MVNGPGAPQKLAEAMRIHQAGRWDEAEQAYRRILSDHPADADALHLLGVLEHQRGRHEAALALIDRAIARNPAVAAFHNNRGNVLNALDRTAEAAEAFSQAIARKPDHAEAHFNLGVARQRQDLLPAAAAAYRGAVTLRPDQPDGWANLANTLQSLGESEEALAALLRSLRLRPGSADAYANLGNILRALGREAEAGGAYRQALTLDPHHPAANNNMALLLVERGDLAEALPWFRRALALKPDLADAATGLANALVKLGRDGEAATAWADAARRFPDEPEPQLGLAMASIPILPATAQESSEALPRFDAALDRLATWSATHPGRLQASAGSSQPFHLAYRPSDLTAALSRYGALIADGTTGFDPVPLAAGERLRLTLVSAHVREHPVWRVILREMLAGLDRERFELTLCHVGTRTDGETAWARSRVDRFIGRARPRDQWRAEIARGRPHAVLYPEIGMDPVTAGLAALRLAPVQVAAWGHPVTSGLPTIDLFLSGELLEGVDAGRHYRETLVCLPGTGAFTRAPDPAAEPWHHPDARPGAVRFALCHQPIKFDPADDALLPRIAATVGDCEFWLVAPHRQEWAADRLKARLAQAFGRAGLDPARYLRLCGWMPERSFNGFLDAMDGLLDCPAFSGYTTARQALGRGLPIVTLEGRFMRQRLASGLLRQIGETDGVTADTNAYVAAAANLAQERRHDPQWRERRRQRSLAASATDQAQVSLAALEQVLVRAVAGDR